MAAFTYFGLAQTLGFLRSRKRKRGRPRKIKPPSIIGLGPPKRSASRPVKFTPDLELTLVTAIDQAKARAAKVGDKLTDHEALRAHMRHLFMEEFIAKGETPRDARRLANEKARALEASPGFGNRLKRLQERLSRVRQRQRLTRS